LRAATAAGIAVIHEEKLFMSAGRLAGAVAIVTGASAGIGATTAITFAREGAKVAVVARNQTELQRVAGMIAAAGGEALVVKADVTVTAEVEAMVQAVMARWGRIDILVNGVGGWTRLAPLIDIPDEEWDATLTLNLTSTFRIINMASQSGVGPNSGTGSNIPYACSKAAVIALTKHLAKQLGPDGITVNTVSPGTTLTARVAGVWDVPTQQKKAAGNALRCLVEPQDSADACLFLASREARHITGLNMNVNAGSAMV
jgi:3-oxoacyl-[acyl-carrier protein] reductase